MVFLLCFPEITILTTAGRHDMIPLDTSGLQKFEISHMFSLFSLGTNRLTVWAASGVTAISIYLYHRSHHQHFKPPLGGFFSFYLGWKRTKSRFGRLLKVSSLNPGPVLSRFEQT